MRKPARGRAIDSGALWETWRTLVREFGFGRLALHLIKSRSGWGFYGMDVVSTLKRTPMARKALVHLEACSDVELDRLADLAAVNARRNEALWRMAALFYITVPVTLFLAGLEGAPDFIRDFLDTLGWVGVAVFVSVTVQMLHYFASHWRARQIEAVIDIARIERGVALTRS